jgi:hypothetical protein
VEDGKISLSASFGVFFAGSLVARLYDEHGRSLGTVPIMDVTPVDVVSLSSEIAPPSKAARVSVHLIDQSGIDRGALQEVPVGSRESMK